MTQLRCPDSNGRFPMNFDNNLMKYPIFKEDDEFVRLIKYHVNKNDIEYSSLILYCDNNKIQSKNMAYGLMARTSMSLNMFERWCKFINYEYYIGLTDLDSDNLKPDECYFNEIESMLENRPEKRIRAEFVDILNNDNPVLHYHIYTDDNILVRQVKYYTNKKMITKQDILDYFEGDTLSAYNMYDGIYKSGTLTLDTYKKWCEMLNLSITITLTKCNK